MFLGFLNPFKFILSSNLVVSISYDLGCSYNPFQSLLLRLSQVCSALDLVNLVVLIIFGSSCLVHSDRFWSDLDVFGSFLLSVVLLGRFFLLCPVRAGFFLKSQESHGFGTLGWKGLTLPLPQSHNVYVIHKFLPIDGRHTFATSIISLYMLFNGDYVSSEL